jgi:eukaryotic-like serine/threonine-protein kinase
MPGRSKRRTESVIGHVFCHDNYTYDVRRPLIVHPDYDTMLIALRSHAGRSEAPQAVVIKAVNKYYQRQANHRMIEEVELARCLRHPKIASILGIAYDDKQPYIVMEYTPGCFLASAISAAVMLRRKLSPQAAAYVAAEVAEALDYAHRCVDDHGKPLGIVHRAVSPVSIRLDNRGGVRLMNFGAAWSQIRRRVASPATLLRGNPAYMAPETVLGFIPDKRNRSNSPPLQRPDRRADVFSLGLVLLESLTATHPLDPPDKRWPKGEDRFHPDFQSEHSAFIPVKQLANRVLQFDPELVAQDTRDVPEALRPIIARALRLDPNERYHSAAEMRNELLSYLCSVGVPFRGRKLEAEVSSLLKEVTDQHFFVVSGGIERGLFRDSPVDGRKN